VEAFHAIVKSLKELGDTETLLIQSGKPIGILPTHADAPRVLISNSMLVPNWAIWKHFDELEKKGYNKNNDIFYLELADGKHDVPTWARAFPSFLTWGWGNKL
jgi:hypothetical protein